MLSVANWLRHLALQLLAPLRCGSSLNPMRGSCQLITESCCFTLRNNLFLQLWRCVISVLRLFQQSFSHITMVATCCIRHDNARLLSAASTDAPCR